MQVWIISTHCSLESGQAYTIRPFSRRKSMRALSLYQHDTCALSPRLPTAEHAGPVVRRHFLSIWTYLALAPEIPITLGVVFALLGLYEPLVLARYQSLSYSLSQRFNIPANWYD